MISQGCRLWHPLHLFLAGGLKMNKKIYSLALLKVLLDLTDENHIMSQTQICDAIEERYGFRMCRQAFRENINTLQHFGYDISTYTENRKGYYIVSRSITESEAIYLCHSFQHDPAINKEQEEHLRKRLLNLLSRPMSQEVLQTLTTNVKERKDNKFTLENLRLIAEAIRSEVKITFNYYHYNIKKERIKNSKPFEDMEPRFIIEKDGKYYLIATGGRHNSISHFRVDRICDLIISSDTITADFEYIEAYEYAMKRIYMFSGESVLVKFRCSKHVPNIYDKMIDEFDDDVQFEDIDDDWFEIITRGTVKGIQYIAQKYIDVAFVTFPQSIRNSLESVLSKSLELYQIKDI